MLTDDPGTPGAGNWEINAAYIGERTYGGRVDSFPHIDITYGLGEHFQLKYETGWLFVNERNGREQRSGLDNSLFGVKWRFMDRDDHGVDVSVYPQLELQNPDRAVARGITTPGPNLFLPVEFAAQLGPVRLVGEVGYQWLRKEHDEWVAGILGAYEATEGLELLAELRSISGKLLNGGGLIANIGLRKDLGSRFKLLASAGTGVNNGPARTQFIGYLGVQWLLGPETRGESDSASMH